MRGARRSPRAAPPGEAKEPQAVDGRSARELPVQARRRARSARRGRRGLARGRARLRGGATRRGALHRARGGGRPRHLRQARARAGRRGDLARSAGPARRAGLALTGEPPHSRSSTLASATSASRRLPVKVERVGTGAPSVGSQAIVAEYAGAGPERLLVVAGAEQRLAWKGSLCGERVRGPAGRQVARSRAELDRRRIRSSIASTASCADAFPSSCCIAASASPCRAAATSARRSAGAGRRPGFACRAPTRAPRAAARAASLSVPSRPRRGRAQRPASRDFERRDAPATRTARDARSPPGSASAAAVGHAPARQPRDLLGPRAARCRSRRAGPPPPRRATPRSACAGCASGSWVAASQPSTTGGRSACSLRAPPASSSSALARRRAQLLGPPDDEHLRPPFVRRERRPRQDQRAHLVDAEVLRLRCAPADLAGS